MQLFLSLKSMPELRQRSWKERRQLLWQAGLKPFRRGRVWAALAVSSLVTLWGLDTFVGNMLLNPELGATDKGFASALTVLLAVVIPAIFIYRHAYLKALRPYIRNVSFDPAGSWWGAAFRGFLVDMVTVLLLFACVAGLDWAINSFDETPDPRIAALQNWPEPIPDDNNGFIAAIGLQAPPGASPFEAGQRWIAAVNEAISKHAKDYPKAPEGLKYAPYVVPAPAPEAGAEAKPKAKTKTDPDRAGPYARFCNPGTGSCLKIMHQEQKAVEAWLAANPELLTRYLALQKYLQWQYSLKQGDASAPLPPFATLVRAQSLMHASALLSIEKGQTGKGLDMLGDDIRFMRNMLGSKDSLIGKMVATTMLSRDLAVLAEITEERPNDLKPHWPQIEKMVEPLTAAQVSTGDAFRFEERWVVALMSPDLLSQEWVSAPLGNNAWATHHFKQTATANLLIRIQEKVIQQTEIRDAGYTPPKRNEDTQVMSGMSRVTGFMHNLGGIAVVLSPSPDYFVYSNRTYDLNALNNLVRLRLALAKNNVSAKEVAAFLNNGDKTLWNPETGKPFEWDAGRKQIYFSPVTDSFKQHTTLGSGVEGRAGITVQE
jgi:hypothetical protein